MQELTNELTQILTNARAAYDCGQTTWTQYQEAKAALLEDAALQAELTTED